MPSSYSIGLWVPLLVSHSKLNRPDLTIPVPSVVSGVGLDTKETQTSGFKDSSPFCRIWSRTGY